MTKTEIQLSLKESYNTFISYIDSLEDSDFEYAPDGKWSAGQQVDHLIRSVYPLSLGLILPSFALKWIFGTSNRPSKSYEALVEKYKIKLTQGGKASGRFIPGQVKFMQKQNLCRKLSASVKKLNSRLDQFSEDALDTLIIPHPLLGKLTLREMMYFTIYHSIHHHDQTKANLSQRSH
ncbi:MAG: DinB family protein [Saprospiraceae bacterium]|nr:DinB family protein [Saprospiraceae bacterium]